MPRHRKHLQTYNIHMLPKRIDYSVGVASLVTVPMKRLDNVIQTD